MNPMQLLKIKNLWDEFASRHPKFPLFLKDVLQKGVQEGSIFEVKVTSPDGHTAVTNIKISKKDLELFQALKKMNK